MIFLLPPVPASFLCLKGDVRDKGNFLHDSCDGGSLINASFVLEYIFKFANEGNKKQTKNFCNKKQHKVDFEIIPQKHFNGKLLINHAFFFLSVNCPLCSGCSAC